MARRRGRADPSARNPLRLAADLVTWAVATAIVAAVFAVVAGAAGPLLAWVYAPVSILAQFAWGSILLYRGRYRVGSADESAAIGRTVAATAITAGAITLGVGLWSGHLAPAIGFAVLTPPLAAAAILLGRIGRRAGRHFGTAANDSTDVIVYGAGEAGEQLLRLLRSPDVPYHPVGLIDDDPRKRNLRLAGATVLGNGGDLERLVEETGVETVILAIGRPDRELVASLSDRMGRLGGTLRVIPPVAQIIDGQVRMSDVRDVEITDILGRRPISTDIGAIAGYLAHRRVLVTGAGGSIGAELARQVHHLGPASLTLLDRDESALHAVQLSLYGNGLLDTPDTVLADIRDPQALRAVFEQVRPQVVFHAAALKHLPMLERYPEEGWKTNVIGTLNLLRLATEFDVERFITISTDKAANPTSVLGRSKLLAERLTAWAAHDRREPGDERAFVSVRFGNVLGSRGSMLDAFRYQILSGGPVTVTHPDATRYFMTIPEACELVIQAAALGAGGEVLVLDMGDPVRILDVAQLLIARSGRDIPIVFTGLRPGEKMHEDLFGATEHGGRPLHPMISHVTASPLAPSALPREHASWARDAAEDAS